MPSDRRGNPCGCLLAQKHSPQSRRGQAPPLQTSPGKFLAIVGATLAVAFSHSSIPRNQGGGKPRHYKKPRKIPGDRRGNPCGCLLAQQHSPQSRRGQAPPLQKNPGKFLMIVGATLAVAFSHSSIPRNQGGGKPRHYKKKPRKIPGVFHKKDYCFHRIR